MEGEIANNLKSCNVHCFQYSAPCMQISIFSKFKLSDSVYLSEVTCSLVFFM